MVDYAEYLQSAAWAAKRVEALERAAYRCQLCNSDRRLAVHHRTYERLGDELPADLTVLCNGCHERFHGHRGAHRTAPVIELAPRRHGHEAHERRQAAVNRAVATLVEGTVYTTAEIGAIAGLSASYAGPRLAALERRMLIVRVRRGRWMLPT